MPTSMRCLPAPPALPRLPAPETGCFSLILPGGPHLPSRMHAEFNARRTAKYDKMIGMKVAASFEEGADTQLWEHYKS